jgi:hypothetical protein
MKTLMNLWIFILGGELLHWLSDYELLKQVSS